MYVLDGHMLYLTSQFTITSMASVSPELLLLTELGDDPLPVISHPTLAATTVPSSVIVSALDSLPDAICTVLCNISQ